MKYHFLPFLLTAFTVGCVGLSVPSAESSAVPESVTSEIAATDNALKITELIQIDPIQFEADLRYENGSGAYIKLDNPDEIQALMNELTAVSVRETENSVGHSFFPYTAVLRTARAMKG
ncbi:MAG: hypothetical protein IKD69_10350 [Solobacterium sp.]|nr:hypothetical protein [Solobacterium sp.]